MPNRNPIAAVPSPSLARLKEVAEQREREKAADEFRSACSTVFFALLGGAVFLTLGWNYGVTECIQALGGPDGNINILEGLALFVFVGVLKRGTDAPAK